MAGRVPQAALRAASHPSFLLTFVSLLAVLPAARIGCHAWGHDGHAFTCAIAQALLTDEAAAAVAALLPAMARGSLPAVCSWADVIAHTKGWGWSSPLHYIDTPDFACSYDERRDCAFAHHPGVCVANAIINYTSQLLTYSPHSSSQPNYYSRRSFPPSSPQVTTLLKPAGLPTSPHQRSFLLRGVDEAEAAVLGGAEEEGEGREGVAEGGEGEEEMVQVVRRVVQVVRGVVRDGARKAAHASILAAAVPARQKEAVDVAFESTQKLPARQQQEAVEVGSIKRYNLTEALMFLAHFAGDIHQPLHVGFTSDLGGNRVHVTWFKRKTNLHAVWDSFIIASAIHLRYNGSSTAMLHHIAHQLASDWRPLIPAWASCLGDNRSYAAAEAALAVSPAEAAACPAVYAMEGAKDACKWAYRNATPGAVLGDEYFSSRLPIVEMRIAMGGVRLARILNRIFAPLRAQVTVPLFTPIWYVSLVVVMGVRWGARGGAEMGGGRKTGAAGANATRQRRRRGVFNSPEMHEAGQKEAAKVFLPLGTSLDVSQLDLCEGLQAISLKRIFSPRRPSRRIRASLYHSRVLLKLLLWVACTGILSVYQARTVSAHGLK
ncbi:unnamed protein product, partial [Closterium sp. NIES-54]